MWRHRGGGAPPPHRANWADRRGAGGVSAEAQVGRKRGPAGAGDGPPTWRHLRPPRGPDFAPRSGAAVNSQQSNPTACLPCGEWAYLR